MKFLKDMFDKKRPDFEKGGKLEKFYPLFEAKETFLFVLPHRTKDGSHVRDSLDTKRLMSIVIVALLPCFLFGMYNVGYQHFKAIGELETTHFCSVMLFGAIKVMPIVIVSYAAGGVWELLFAVIRKHEINEGFLVTGLLVPLTLPPTVPLWQVAVGVSFGVVIGKEVFGGTGMNIFNPALTARAFMFFAFAGTMSGDSAWIALNAADQVVDGFSGATPLAHAYNIAQTAEAGNLIGALADKGLTLKTMFLGNIPGSIGETSTLCCLIGAIVLVATGIGSWRIMIGVLLGTAVAGGIIDYGFKDTIISSGSGFFVLPIHYHLAMGGYAFGLVFMATDPVSAAQTKIGKWIYGALIGVVVIIIRVINPAYPEGMMLSILFGNVFASMIDHYVVQAHVKRRLTRVEKA